MGPPPCRVAEDEHPRVIQHLPRSTLVDHEVAGGLDVPMLYLGDDEPYTDFKIAPEATPASWWRISAEWAGSRAASRRK